MQKFIGIMLLALDVILIPISLISYVIQSIILLYACIRFGGDLKTEFKDFNEIIVHKIKAGLKIHKDRIIGD